MTGPDTGVGAMVPAVVDQERALLPAARVQAPAGMGQDLVRSISEAAAGVRFVDATGSGAADISVTALTALVCTGDTEAAAMQAAADRNRRVPGIPEWNLCELPGGSCPYRCSVPRVRGCARKLRSVRLLGRRVGGERAQRHR
jgi:hypothetical protein